jgi:regulatory protein
MTPAAKPPSKPRGSRKHQLGRAVGPARPRPVTASYLRNSALHYLASRAASATMVRQTLQRRARRRLAVRALDADIETLIDKAVIELITLGLIDDAKFAESRTATLVRKGFSRGRIAQGLNAKGLGKEVIATTVGDEIDDLAQARRFVERRRLGSNRRGGASPESRKKDLSALARAGFSFAIATAALRDDAAESENGDDGLVK